MLAGPAFPMLDTYCYSMVLFVQTPSMLMQYARENNISENARFSKRICPGIFGQHWRALGNNHFLWSSWFVNIGGAPANNHDTTDQDMFQVNIDQGGSFSVCILLRLDPVALSWSRYQFLFNAYFPRSYFAFRFGSNDFGGTAFTRRPTSIMHTSRKWCLVSTKHMVLQEWLLKWLLLSSKKRKLFVLQ